METIYLMMAVLLNKTDWIKIVVSSFSSSFLKNSEIILFPKIFDT